MEVQINQITPLVRSGRIQFNIAQRIRTPYPEDDYVLPSPPESPGKPPVLNLWTSLLPPLFILIALGGLYYFQSRSGSGANLTYLLPMMLLSLGFPLANFVGHFMQKRNHEKAMRNRELIYKQALEKARGGILQLLRSQRQIAETEYPNVDRTVNIGRLASKQLWWRRQNDNDFLFCRLGTGKSKASFNITPPRQADNNDPLMLEAMLTIPQYAEVDSMPITFDLRKVGSMGIKANSRSQCLGMAQRITLDIIVHQSPTDLQLAVVSDEEQKARDWQWLKWAPHTRALDLDQHQPLMAFSSSTGTKILDWLVEEYKKRSKPLHSSGLRRNYQASIVVILDDSGFFRELSELVDIAENGHECGIHVIFVGGRWPSQCRALLELSSNGRFNYHETWEGASTGLRLNGIFEIVSQKDCETVTRQLSSLDLIGGPLKSASLPLNIPISRVLSPQGEDVFNADTIQKYWVLERTPRELLKFPIGVHVDRGQLATFELDLRPEELGGKHAFNAIMIGMPGSGKSVLFHSILISAAYRYSPMQINFMIMDFKGGIEFDIWKETPHTVGCVSNLGPAYAQRAMLAIDTEMERRQRLFTDAGVKNIWQYNTKNQTPMPHLLVMIDEFGNGIREFPELLDLLVSVARLGRALGIYLILANQEVVVGIERLLAFTDWVILLRVGKQEDMNILDAQLAPPEKPGRGYIKVKDEIHEFQAVRSDAKVHDQIEQMVSAFSIYRIGVDGNRETIYKRSKQSSNQMSPSFSEESELSTFINLFAKTTEQFGHKKATPIYLDPLPEKILLSNLSNGISMVHYGDFKPGGWSKFGGPETRLSVPVGMLDYPALTRQIPLIIDFKERDGHLWVVGSPGSGKNLCLETILLALAASHSPQDINFYFLDFGGARLKDFDRLPHTGSYIRKSDPVEKVERLLNFLEEELKKRSEFSETSSNKKIATNPAIFVIINNFAEFRITHPDLYEEISQLIQDGASADIHLIVATNRNSEIPRSLSANISKRMVLELNSKDEYADVLGLLKSAPSIKALGRGYWQDREVTEFQIAQPFPIMDLDEEIETLEDVVELFDQHWVGTRPEKIEVLRECIPYDEITKNKLRSDRGTFVIPIGVRYDDLSACDIDLMDEQISNAWLILGPSRSGKSNFLSLVATVVRESKKWEPIVISPRQNSFSQRLTANGIPVWSTPDQICKGFEILEKRFSNNEFGRDRHAVLLLDDMDRILKMKHEVLIYLDKLTSWLELSEYNKAIVVIASSSKRDLLPQITSSTIVRALQKSQSGLVFSNDVIDFEWHGILQLPIKMRRLRFPAGRGFIVMRRQPALIQTLYLGEC